MTRIYATAEDYADWAGPDATVPSIGALRAASLLIEDEVLRYCAYPTDVSGMPTDPDHVEAIRDAVCAQVQYADEIGDIEGIGAAGEIQSASILGVSFTNAPTAGNRIAPLAAAILRSAGLTATVIVSG